MDFGFRGRGESGKKTGGVAEGEGRCRDDVVGLLARNRRKFKFLWVKKIAKLSATEISGAEEGKGWLIGWLVGWSLTSLFSTNKVIPETRKLRVKKICGAVVC